MFTNGSKSSVSSIATSCASISSRGHVTHSTLRISCVVHIGTTSDHWGSSRNSLCGCVSWQVRSSSGDPGATGHPAAADAAGGAVTDRDGLHRPPLPGRHGRRRRVHSHLRLQWVPKGRLAVAGVGDVYRVVNSSPHVGRYFGEWWDQRCNLLHSHDWEK